MVDHRRRSVNNSSCSRHTCGIDCVQTQKKPGERSATSRSSIWCTWVFKGKRQFFHSAVTELSARIPDTGYIFCDFWAYSTVYQLIYLLVSSPRPLHTTPVIVDLCWRKLGRINHMIIVTQICRFRRELSKVHFRDGLVWTLGLKAEIIVRI